MQGRWTGPTAWIDHDHLVKGRTKLSASDLRKHHTMSAVDRTKCQQDPGNVPSLSWGYVPRETRPRVVRERCRGTPSLDRSELPRPPLSPMKTGFLGRLSPIRAVVRGAP